jgi:hypothetical protein
MTKDEALKMAIEAIERLTELDGMYSWADHLTACKEALEQPAQDTYTAKPAEDYDNLKKQFFALRSLANSLQDSLNFYQKQDYDLSKERLDSLEKLLESELEMNAILTEELSTLEQPAQEPRKVDLYFALGFVMGIVLYQIQKYFL